VNDLTEIIDIFLEHDDASRVLVAQRLGLESAVTRVMAEELRTPRGARRAFRKASDAGAEALIRHLVEHGGHPVASSDVVDRLVRRLTPWFPLRASGTDWAIPVDLASAMVRCARSERFFAATLVGRMSEASIRQLSAELGVGHVGSVPARRARVVAVISAGNIDDEPTREAAARTKELATLPSREVARVEPIDGAQGARVELTTTGGQTYVVAPREIAERLGHTFAPARLGQSAASQERQRVSRTPTFSRIGTMITFTTTRAADEALRLPSFREMVMHRLDERRVVTTVDCDERGATSLLTRLGYSVVSNPSGGSSFHASP
jgi:predicted DCC family thiol-disulfide oxidoreductase YuxK